MAVKKAFNESDWAAEPRKVKNPMSVRFPEAFAFAVRRAEAVADGQSNKSFYQIYLKAVEIHDMNIGKDAFRKGFMDEQGELYRQAFGR